MDDAYRDLGPTLPPRAEVYAMAIQLQELARLTRDCATPGTGLDLARAVKTLDRARALLAEPGE